MSKESKTYKNMPKKIYIRTFGCQMNDRDTEIIYGMLLREGYVKAQSLGEADVILFNTCSVRKHAEDRVYGKVGMLKDLKIKRFGFVLGIVGCMAQNYKEAILEKLPHVDFVCGPGNIYDIPELIEKTRIKGVRSVAVDKLESPRRHWVGSASQRKIGDLPLHRTEKMDTGKIDFREGDLKAYVSISEGCNNFCSYCIVPFVRGREVSRDPGKILEEVQDLVKRGFREITLLGQNVNSYGQDLDGGINFVNLLEQVDWTGIERLRFITSHPKDAEESLFMAMRDLSSVCEHLHLPVQSGSNRILDMMDRGYTKEDFLRLVASLRGIIPDVAITTDIVVGFPSETEQDFEDTVDLMREIEFDSAFIFKYSPRPPAISSQWKDDVPLRVKQKRNQMLLELQDEVYRKKFQSLVGRRFEVLVDGLAKIQKFSEASKDAQEQMVRNASGDISEEALRGKIKRRKVSLQGRTRTDRVAVFEGTEELVGKTVMVEIEGASAHTLRGRLVG